MLSIPRCADASRLACLSALRLQALAGGLLEVRLQRGHLRDHQRSLRLKIFVYDYGDSQFDSSSWQAFKFISKKFMQMCILNVDMFYGF